MKALSIRQPWAWAIVHLGKDIENRSWATNYRGLVLIHASAFWRPNEILEDAREAVSLAKLSGHSFIPDYYDATKAVTLRTLKAQIGGIVGRAIVTDCVDYSLSPWFSGRYGFVLTEIEPLPFTPWKGRLGFFDVPDDAGQNATSQPVLPSIQLR